VSVGMRNPAVVPGQDFEEGGSEFTASASRNLKQE